jgi:hypothetical protein
MGWGALGVGCLFGALTVFWVCCESWVLWVFKSFWAFRVLFCGLVGLFLCT